MKIRSQNILIFLLLVTIAQGCMKDNSAPKYNEVELEILELVNQYRLLNNLSVLEMNNFLYSEATEHTKYMIERGVISHDKSDERFELIQTTLDAGSFAENVASGQMTAQQVVTAWLNSDGHRRNIEGNYNVTGISAIRNKQGQYYYTQIFTHLP